MKIITYTFNRRNFSCSFDSFQSKFHSEIETVVLSLFFEMLRDSIVTTRSVDSSQSFVDSLMDAARERLYSQFVTLFNLHSVQGVFVSDISEPSSSSDEFPDVLVLNPTRSGLVVSIEGLYLKDDIFIDELACATWYFEDSSVVDLVSKFCSMGNDARILSVFEHEGFCHIDGDLTEDYRAINLIPPLVAVS